MKKTNARRFVAMALALLMILPIVSVPAFATGTSQTLTNGSNPKKAVEAVEALFTQDFEAFDTLKGPLTPSRNIFNGPKSAKIIASSDDHGNVLQIDCQAAADDGRLWICFSNNRNYWVEIKNATTQKPYHHPFSTDGEGANISNVDIYASDMQEPMIHTAQYIYITDGTVKTPSDQTYRVRGILNTETCEIQCQFYSYNAVATDYEGMPEYEYEYEYFSKYEYEYKYEYELEYETNADGSYKLDANNKKIPKLDEKGNPIYKLDDNGQKIIVYDENGNPKYALDSNGNKIPATDSAGNIIIAKDENGKNLVYRYEYEYETDEDGSYKLDENNKKIPVLDAEGNPVYKLDSNGERVSSLEGEGERVPVLTANGEKIPLRYPNGEYVPARDDEGNIIYKVDANGDYIPMLDAGGNPVYQYDEIGIKIPKLDENGEIVYLEGELKDVHGKPVYEKVALEEINYRGSKLVEKRDENGNIIYEVAKEPALNADGTPQLDENGNPVMVPVMVPDLDENGNQKYVETDETELRLDENGNPVGFEKQVVVYETDADGNIKTDADGNPIPVKVQATTAVRDENGDVVYQYVYDGNGDADAAAPYWETQYEADGVTPKKDQWGNVIQYWVYPTVGKPIQQQLTDADGNLLYDAFGNPMMGYKKDRLLTWRYKADGTPQMMVKTEVQIEYYYDKKLVPAPDVEKMVPAMVEEMTIPVTSLHIANSSLKDAYGGGTNIAREAYPQSAALNSDLLIFSSDYYFSEDLTRGVDIRITAVMEDGTNKAFDFVNISNPDLASGTVEIRTDNAPTHHVTNSVKVPLGAWCNIMIVADFTSGTFALYVNGQMISVRQNIRVTQQLVEKEVIVNSQVPKYEYTGSYVPLKVNGEKVMTKQLDADGNPIMQKLVDENGNYVYDETTGEHVYEYLMVPVMVPQLKTDENDNPIVVMTDKVDENGNIVYEYKYDENGNQVMTEQRDEDGNIVMIEKTDENGNFIIGADGNPEMIPAMVPEMVPVQVPATTDKYDMVYDEDGVLCTQFLRNSSGKIVTITRTDFDGNSVKYPVMIPVEEVATEVKCDADGNPVTEQVVAMAPDPSGWTIGAVGIKAGTWNLGHFHRGGNVSDYKGYMYIDNIAIYDGKDIEKVFASKGYTLDYNQTYDGMTIGDIVKIEGKDTSSCITTDPAGNEDDLALRVDYDDVASKEANYTPVTDGFTYMSTNKVVLEANYFLEEGSAGQIQSQFWNMGAFLDVPNAGFAYSNQDSTTRIYRWVDLYTIQTTKDATQARVTSYGSDDPEMMLDLGKWHAFSFVLDLSNGEYTLYINGIVAFRGRLRQEIKDVDGQTKTFHFRNISVGSEQWIVSKVSERQAAYEGSFYVDDVTVTKLGGERAYMQRIGGLLSADLYANGEKVQTFTDENYFLITDLIKLENVEVYDIGIDQLLKTDDESIRFTSPSGIRFTTWVDVEALEALYGRIERPLSPTDEGAATAEESGNGQGVSLKAVSFGTLIIPSDLLDGRELTFDVLEENNLPYLDIKGTRGYYYDVDGDGVGTHIAGSLINIKEENIDRLYSAVSYVRIVLETGVVYNIYGHRVAKNSAQSVADDVFGAFTPAEQAVIDAFLAGKKPAADLPPIVVASTSEE